MLNQLMYEAGQARVKGKTVRVVVYRQEGEYPFCHVAEVKTERGWERVLPGQPERYYTDSQDEAHFMLNDIKGGFTTLDL